MLVTVTCLEIASIFFRCDFYLKPVFTLIEITVIDKIYSFTTNLELCNKVCKKFQKTAALTGAGSLNTDSVVSDFTADKYRLIIITYLVSVHGVLTT